MNYSIDPTRSQFDAFKSLARDTPIMMLNLIRLNDRAKYEDGRSLSGQEAYQIYGKESLSIFARVGGSIMWRGRPECVLIGPNQEHWDIAFIAHYPSGGAFLEMVSDPAYQAIVYHRQAAVEDSRLIRMGEAEAGSGFSS